MSTTATVPQPAAADYRMVGRTMIIQSSTDPRISYAVTDRGCSCPGFKFRSTCKHATLRLEVLTTRQPMSDKQYADVLEACDELF